MPALEHVIRPIVVEDFGPAPQPSAIVDPQKQERSFELDGGSMQILENTYSLSTSQSKQYKQQEAGRAGDIMRVRNKEDHDQYVDVEVPQSIRHAGGTARVFGKVRDYEPMEETDHIEKIGEFSRGDVGGGRRATIKE